jgi:hypothetical protein
MAGSAVLSLLMFLLAAGRGVHKDYCWLSGRNPALDVPHRRPPGERESLRSLPRTWASCWERLSCSSARCISPTHGAGDEPGRLRVSSPFRGDYQRAHGFVRIHHEYVREPVEGLELLFLFAYVFGRHSAAAMAMLYLFALPWMLIMWGRRNGHAVAGAAAAMFTFLSPVMGIEARARTTTWRLPPCFSRPSTWPTSGARSGRRDCYP